MALVRPGRDLRGMTPNAREKYSRSVEEGQERAVPGEGRLYGLGKTSRRLCYVADAVSEEAEI